MQHNRIIDALLRSDFRFFLRRSFAELNPAAQFENNWHIDLISEYLRSVEDGDCRRLIVNMPPRSLKSIMVSVAWPAWLLGHAPHKRIIVASYSSSLADKLSLDTRLIINSAWYRRIFPHMQVMRGQDEKHKFMTTRGGFRLAVSVGGSVTGEGGDVLIIDDPHNPTYIHEVAARSQVQHWFDNTFSTRLNDSARGAILLVMQRLHEDDLTAHLLHRSKDWELLRLPSIAPQHEEISYAAMQHSRIQGELLHPRRQDDAALQQLRRTLGSNAFAAQYQQDPVPTSGGMVEAGWLQRYKDAPPRDGGRLIHSWDTAIKTGNQHDFSALAVLQEVRSKGDAASQHRYYLTNIQTYKHEFSALKEEITRRAAQDRPDAILLEDKASGASMLQMLRGSGLPLIPIVPSKSKETRLLQILPLIESGRLLLPEFAPWLASFERELLSFPGSAHDDMVDALTQGLSYLTHPQCKPNIRSL